MMKSKKEKFILSKKIEKGGCIENCLCNRGDPTYEGDGKIHSFIDVENVKEFIKRLNATILFEPSPTDRKGFVEWLLKKIDELAGEELKW